MTAIVLAGALPGLVLTRVITPALGLYPAAGAFCGYETLLMLALGFVGASAGSWRFTIVGILILMPLQLIGERVYHVASGALPLPQFIPTWEDLKWWTLYSLLHFIPAAITHKIAAWAQQKPKPGHCLNCDYDLTGNTSGRCPECGQIVERAA